MNGYMILCLRNSRELIGFKEFELKIYSTNKLINCLPNNKYNYLNKTFEIFDKWCKYKAGGCFYNNIYFIQNPIYQITPLQTTKVYIELISHDKHKVGIAILESQSNFGGVNSYDPAINNTFVLEQTLISLEEELNFENSFFEEGKKYLIFPYTDRMENVRRKYNLLLILIGWQL